MGRAGCLKAAALRNQAQMQQEDLIRLALVCTVRMRLVMVRFGRFEFLGRFVFVVVMLMMFPGYLFRGERRACKYCKQQSRGQNFLHATNPNMLSNA
jgi:hypothetical protein